VKRSFLLIALIVLLGAGPVRAAPGDANDRGVEYLKQGKVTQAIDELQKAVEQNPKDTASRMNLAYAYEREGRLDEAIFHYEKVLVLKPQDAVARNNLGVLYDKKGLYDEAIGEFEAVLKIDPKSATGPKNLDTAKKNQSLIQEREKQIAEALKNAEAQPENPNTSYKLARLYAAYGKKDQAIGWLEKALKLGFNDIGYLKVDSALDSLRNEPDYVWLLRGR
jgi:tetratricopeptide (TPR) repeat protein